MNVSRPHLLPNGRAVVFGTRSGGSQRSRIFIFEIETGEVRELVPAGNQPRYVSTGHLIYGHGDGALMGVPFDLETLQVTGAPVTLLSSLAVFAGGASQFGVSSDGTLIYATAAGGDSGALTWVDMEGTETPLPLRGCGEGGEGNSRLPPSRRTEAGWCWARTILAPAQTWLSLPWAS